MIDVLNILPECKQHSNNTIQCLEVKCHFPLPLYIYDEISSFFFFFFDRENKTFGAS